MNEKEKNKRYFKRLLPLFILFVVCFGALGWSFMVKGSKVNAGVIISENYVVDSNVYDLQGSFNVNALQLDQVQWVGLESIYTTTSQVNIFMRIYSDQRENTTLSGTLEYQLRLLKYDGATANVSRVEIFCQRSNSALPTIPNTYCEMKINEINNIKYYMVNLSNVLNQITNDNYTCVIAKQYNTTLSVGNFFTPSATIAPCNNIYDLEEKDLCLLYLSDISELSTSVMREEITINWGYIDENDNTLYAEYAPTIGAQNMQADDDTIIRLGIPINNNGSASEYVDISQKALLSTISADNGGATATAHIYGVYIWRSYNMIEWGLAEFDTTSIPASGASMNYLTGTTRKYQYQNTDTITMTCRISVSSNFNFITIKNQNMVDVATINQTIRQGGFLPAWAVYNWARGSASGFNAGEDYANAQYQEGQAGYNTIYQAGYYDGLNANIGTQNWFVSAFSAVDALLNIRILPNITIGTIIGIPFVISLVWFIIRTFRGGGGN